MDKDIKKWKQAQSLAKKDEVLQTHFIFSTVEEPTEKNAQKLEIIIKNVQDTFKLNGQHSMFAIHTDKKHLHAHIIVNKFNDRCEKYIKKPFLMAIKEKFKDDLNLTYNNNYIILKKNDAVEKTPEKILNF